MHEASNVIAFPAAHCLPRASAVIIPILERPPPAVDNRGPPRSALVLAIELRALVSELVAQTGRAATLRSLRLAFHLATVGDEE